MHPASSVPFICVPGMAQFQRVKVPPRVVTAKCSEPQAAESNNTVFTAREPEEIERISR